MRLPKTLKELVGSKITKLERKAFNFIIYTTKGEIEIYDGYIKVSGKEFTIEPSQIFGTTNIKQIR